MSFASRQIRCPDAYDVARGQDAIAAVADIDPALHPLIAGAAGCSPYLAGLIAKEAAFLPTAFDDPEAALDAIIASLPDLTVATLPDGLRTAKRRVALVTALADLAGVWPLEVVTQYLTDFANACVDTCIRKLVGAEVTRGKVPGMTAADLDTACGMTALAMGKMGAGELNYSSDIDLICLYDETRFDPDDYHNARTAFVRVTRRMAAILSDVTGGGYVFRTDLRLRPDPATTPVCLSMEAAERYYESVGRTWERAAYIKASPAGGDIAAGVRFLDTLRPFVWRKHLDFAAIQDAHDMRLKIRDHKGLHGPLVLEGHNMKLGRGGIREIEFFTQTRQLIAGGRDATLRVRGTKDGLMLLAEAGWLPQDHADTLYDHYRAHREVEHRLQMINDQQTHTLPTSDAGFARLAAFMGTSVDALRADLTRRLDEVHTLTEGFFAPDDDVQDTAQSGWAADITSRWPTYPALRSDRATDIFKRLRPEILRRLQDAAKPDEALREFDGFLAGLPAGVQLFSLFEANPALTQLLVDIASTAPALAKYLSRNAGVFDAVIGGSFFDPWPTQEVLEQDLQDVLAAVPDYENRLIAARRWTKEWHFRIGVHHLRGLIDATESGAHYASLAQAVIVCIWPEVITEFARKHGTPPGRGAVVVGMGSLGAGMLNAASDLDLIVIYDADGVDASDGPRALATRPYYARLTQALVTALSAPMSEGRLYEVDMRLRPSGRAGPVATSLQSFRDYQQSQAWTWEHLALTRARVIAGADAVGADFAAVRAQVLIAKAAGAKVLGDVAEMRDRIANAKGNDTGWNAKIGAGHLQDCELFGQTAALRSGSTARDLAAQLKAGVATGWLSDADVQDISAAAGLFWQLQAAAKLLTGGTFEPDELGEGGRRLILRETGCDTMDALAVKMRDAAQAADHVITAKLAKVS